MIDLLILLVFIYIYLKLSKKDKFTQNNKELLYVHIPKTGGTSIEDSLQKHDIDVGRFKSSMKNVELINNVKCEYWHIPPKNMKISFNDYNVFTVIRNPYKRFISEYKHKHRAVEYDDINKFALALKKNPNPYKHNCHIIPQIEYLYDKDGEFVHNILRLEYIKDDFNELKNKYKLDENIELLHNNQHTDDKGTKMNQDTINFINEYYKEDFDLFLQKGYYTKEELKY